MRKSTAISIDIIKQRIPSFLKIDESSYTTISSKANFYDIDYDTHFTTTVSTVIKYQSGCKQRSLDRLRKNNKRFTGKEHQYSKEEIIAYAKLHIHLYCINQQNLEF
jgi:hypothetical protein